MNKHEWAPRPHRNFVVTESTQPDGTLWRDPGIEVDGDYKQLLPAPQASAEARAQFTTVSDLLNRLQSETEWPDTGKLDNAVIDLMNVMRHEAAAHIAEAMAAIMEEKRITGVIGHSIAWAADWEAIGATLPPARGVVPDWGEYQFPALRPTLGTIPPSFAEREYTLQQRQKQLRAAIERYAQAFAIAATDPYSDAALPSRLRLRLRLVVVTVASAFVLGITTPGLLHLASRAVRIVGHPRGWRVYALRL